MEDIIKASVIITTYDRPHLLQRAVESCIQQQIDFKCEIFVIDDNGIDSCNQKKTKELMSKYPTVHYFPIQFNMGACFARNKGLELANGEYIFFLDDDDTFLPHKIKTQIMYMENNPHLDGCLAPFKRIDQDTSIEILSNSNYPNIGEYKNFVICGMFFTPMLCMKKKSLLEIGGFDKIDRFQDRYLMLKALNKGLKFGCLDEQLHIMYEHGEDRITNIGIEKSLKSLNIIYEEIKQNRYLFSKKEWLLYLIKDNRMRGAFCYITNNYRTRLRGIAYYIKSFMYSRSILDLKMIAKSIIKIEI